MHAWELKFYVIAQSSSHQPPYFNIRRKWSGPYLPFFSRLYGHRPVLSDPAGLTMELIRSDAETNKFRQGPFYKLSKCPPEFQLKFLNARKVSKTLQHVCFYLCVRQYRSKTCKHLFSAIICGSISIYSYSVLLYSHGQVTHS